MKNLRQSSTKNIVPHLSLIDYGVNIHMNHVFLICPAYLNLNDLTLFLKFVESPSQQLISDQIVHVKGKHLGSGLENHGMVKTDFLFKRPTY